MRGDRFADSDVVGCYRHRPPYCADVYDFLLARTPHRARALDLGCGPGKIARMLALYFAHVDAVDPSGAMLDEAVSQSGDPPSNVQWQQATGEAASLTGPYDLVTAGASIHWMAPDIVFPRLAACVAPDGHVALIDGDDVFRPPWQAEWQGFLERWLGNVGQQWCSPDHVARTRAYAPWFDVVEERRFVAPFVQGVPELIECQHSRSTWARSAMGDAMAARFDDELRQLLLPYARGGVLSFDVETRVLWGRARAHPRG